MTSPFLAAPLQVAGIVNLLTAFPQLATGLLVARYAVSPSEEFRLRGYPGQLLDLLSAAARVMDAELLAVVTARLEQRTQFLRAYAETVVSRLAAAPVEARALTLTFIDYCGVEGARLAEPLLCLREETVNELAGLAGASPRSIRESDAGFRYLYRYEDPDEPTDEIEEYYYCTARWAPRAWSAIAALIQARKIGGLKEYAEETLRSSVKCYSLLRVTAFHGLRGLRRAEELLETRLDECSPPESLARQGLVNTGLAAIARSALRELEEKVYGSPANGYTWDPETGLYRSRNGDKLALGLPGLVTALASPEPPRRLKLVANRDERGEAEELASRAQVEVELVDNP